MSKQQTSWQVFQQLEKFILRVFKLILALPVNKSCTNF